MSKIPIPDRVKTRDDPPKLIKGRGTPVIGRIPVTAPIFIKAWITMTAVIPEARMRPKKVGALKAILIPR